MAESTVAALLDSWLARVLKPEARMWLDTTVARLADAGPASDLAFFPAFSSAARQVGRGDLSLAPADLADAAVARLGWNPVHWTRDQAARTRLLLALPDRGADACIARLDRLFATAELGELVALYQALPLLPFPERHRGRAAEGVRHNIRAVFTAVANDNPYPAEQLDELAWNQLVLKCLFVGAPLHRVVNCDSRANAELTRMLCDFAHERWAAKRTVPPELWRNVALAADAQAIADLDRALGGDDEKTALGAALAVSVSTDPAVQDLLDRHDPLARRIRSGTVTWESLTAP